MRVIEDVCVRFGAMSAGGEPILQGLCWGKGSSNSERVRRTSRNLLQVQTWAGADRTRDLFCPLEILIFHSETCRFPF